MESKDGIAFGLLLRALGKTKSELFNDLNVALQNPRKAEKPGHLTARRVFLPMADPDQLSRAFTPEEAAQIIENLGTRWLKEKGQSGSSDLLST